MGLTDWIRRIRGSSNGADERAAVETLERVVQLTNPRLRFARRYRTRLTPPIQSAMQHARTVVASVPAACEASAAAWAGDPHLRAFFATADDLVRAFSRSAELRTWFDANR